MPSHTYAYRDLAPMSIGDIFDEAFDLYKRNFALFAGIVAVIGVPALAAIDWFVYALGLDRMGGGPRTPSDAQIALMLGLMAGFIALMMVYSVLYVVQSGALTLAISNRYLNAPCTIGQAYRRLRPAILRLVPTWILVGAILSGIAMALFIGIAFFIGLAAAAMSAGGGPAGNLAAAILAILLFGVPFVAVLASGVWIALFTTQVVVLEGDGFVTAMGRNLDLVRGSFLRMCGAALLIFVVSMGLVITLELTVETLLEVFVYPWAHVPQIWQHVVSSTWNGVVSLFAQPYSMVCLTLLYYDQRVRKEGFDLALLERHLQPAAPVEAPV